MLYLDCGGAGGALQHDLPPLRFCDVQLELQPVVRRRDRRHACSMVRLVAAQ